MPELQLTPPPLVRRPRRLAGLLLALIAFALGAAGVMGWLAWRQHLSVTQLTGLIEHGAGSASLNPSAINASHPSPSPIDLAKAPYAAPVPPAAAPLSDAAITTRMAALDQRLTELDMLTGAEAANAARIEALLTAQGVRRVAERGMPLGMLEDQLKARFGDSAPQAVATVIAAGHDPITRDVLAARLLAIAPALAQPPRIDNPWQRMRDDLAGLFVLRREAASPPPADAALDIALMSLREGRIDAAIAAVTRLPGGAKARGWIAAAHRYAELERALDLIESTALVAATAPRAEAHDAAGKPLHAPAPTTAAPVAPPPPIAASTPHSG